MSNAYPDPLPDPSEVLQEEEPTLRMVPVPVVVEGPVRAQQLPGEQNWAPGQLTVDQNTPQQIVGPDLRRKRLVVITQTTAIFLSDSSSGCLGNRRFRSPVDTTREFTHTGEIWAVGDGGSAVVSWFAEYWTD